MNEDVVYENVKGENVEGENVEREIVVHENVEGEIVVREGNGDAEYEELIRPGLFSALLCCRRQTANESPASALPGE